MNNTKDLISEKEYLEYINKKKDRNENNCKYDVLEKLFKNALYEKEILKS